MSQWRCKLDCWLSIWIIFFTLKKQIHLWFTNLWFPRTKKIVVNLLIKKRKFWLRWTRMTLVHLNWCFSFHFTQHSQLNCTYKFRPFYKRLEQKNEISWLNNFFNLILLFNSLSRFPLTRCRQCHCCAARSFCLWAQNQPRGNLSKGKATQVRN